MDVVFVLHIGRPRALVFECTHGWSAVGLFTWRPIPWLSYDCTYDETLLQYTSLFSITIEVIFATPLATALTPLPVFGLLWDESTSQPQAQLQ